MTPNSIQLPPSTPGIALARVTAEDIAVDAAGVANVIDQSPVTAGTRFAWFSMTKIATATAGMMLVDAGALALDRPAADHLAGLPIDPRITIRDLLQHTSGLSNPIPVSWIHAAGTPGPDQHAMLGRLLSRHRRLRFDPGSHAAYSNIGYLALGQVIAGASGMPFERFVTDRLLRPLGATATTFGVRGPTDAATGHHPRFSPSRPLLALARHPGLVHGHRGRFLALDSVDVDGAAYGGLVGPVCDAARLLQLHLRDGEGAYDRLISAKACREMCDIGRRGGRFDHGLGWFRTHRDTRRGRTHLEHLGSGIGFKACMRLHPSERRGSVVMANTTAFDHEAALAAQ
jgi:CubicO group peptidase (beta-lactamase class C family)